MRRPRGTPLDGDLGRETTLADVEAAIASRWYRKDPALQIVGLTKTPLGTFAGFTCYRVDAGWIKDNLDTTFGTGGHGLVHTFIPLDEIWVDDVDEPWLEIILHEAVEFRYMLQENLSYWEAHRKAVAAEQRGAGALTEENVAQRIDQYAPAGGGTA